MIKAFVVAYDFSQDVINHKNNICIRNYTKGRRPTIPAQWTDVKLIKYRFDQVNKNLIFQEVE
ncbi:hypothetical protein [Tepidibacter formicigenes]|jgi:hypothetical protein|uniref:Uncharacterized protein n=1 Tax=Tepidibacter formicigenes DSM 15518 TaxID=1123349 RepID=A0A1M6TYP3_9FIRM|nr:hypothetical protein [Tepidibacter formicigenes]SHK62145.1 hypothetical protein SAMN02744037_02704 [Tepidibacter formicigenes DSM 15518]